MCERVRNSSHSNRSVGCIHCGEMCRASVAESRGNMFCAVVQHKHSTLFSPRKRWLYSLASMIIGTDPRCGGCDVQTIHSTPIKVNMAICSTQHTTQGYDSGSKSSSSDAVHASKYSHEPRHQHQRRYFHTR